jgi:hypothetical protein
VGGRSLRLGGGKRDHSAYLEWGEVRPTTMTFGFALPREYLHKYVSYDHENYAIE